MFTLVQQQLQSLSHHDWTILGSTWSRGCDWYVGRWGDKRRQWRLHPKFGPMAPVFKTKRAAIEFADTVFLAECSRRALVNANV